MPWLLLVVAGAFEIGFTTCMKLSGGFSKPGWTIGFAVCAISSFVLLALAIRVIPMGTAYAVWTGIGAVGTILVGIFAFGEPAGAMRVALLTTIVLAIVGLKLVER